METTVIVFAILYGVCCILWGLYAANWQAQYSSGKFDIAKIFVLNAVFFPLVIFVKLIDRRKL